VLIAEGERWRWQRRLLAPLFRAEEVTAYVPAFVSACAPPLQCWARSAPGSLQPIHTDIAAATLQVLEDIVLGADLPAEDHRRVAAAVTAFLQPTVWRVAYASLRLPAWTAHPGSSRLAKASRDLREVAGRALAGRRGKDSGGNDLVSRLVAARDPATGEAMPDSLIIDNLVTFLLAGHETTAQALTWTLYLLALLPDWQEKAREEIRRVTGNGPIDGHCLGSGETRMAGAFLSGAIAAVDFDATKADVRRAVEDFLAQLFAKAPDTDVARAVAVAAGKIFRDDALQRVLPAACGVELAHAASLVLDDAAGKALHAIAPFRPGLPT
jgi:cytochrome P450